MTKFKVLNKDANKELTLFLYLEEGPEEGAVSIIATNEQRTFKQNICTIHPNKGIRRHKLDQGFVEDFNIKSEHSKPHLPYYFTIMKCD